MLYCFATRNLKGHFEACLKRSSSRQGQADMNFLRQALAYFFPRKKFSPLLSPPKVGYDAVNIYSLRYSESRAIDASLLRTVALFLLVCLKTSHHPVPIGTAHGEPGSETGRSAAFLVATDGCRPSKVQRGKGVWTGEAKGPWPRASRNLKEQRKGRD